MTNKKKKILAFDVGSHTLGVAQSDALQMFAHPIKTFRYLETEWPQALIAIFDHIKLTDIDTIIIGLPIRLNEVVSESTHRSERFRTLLEKYLEEQNQQTITLLFVDERLTTRQAEQLLVAQDMSRKKRKKVIDTVAAVLILEDYLKTKN